MNLKDVQALAKSQVEATMLASKQAALEILAQIPSHVELSRERIAALIQVGYLRGAQRAADDVGAGVALIFESQKKAGPD